MTGRRLNLWLLGMAAVILVGLALRAPGLADDLPYQLDADEPALYIGAVQVRATGTQTIKPGYSPLRIYELAAEQAILSALSGGEAGQEQLFFFGRVFSALYMALLAGITYRAGRQLAGPAAGLLAALFLAVEPTSAELGRLIRADALAWLLALAALALTFGAARGRRRALAAAFAFGLAAFLAKYNMLPVLAAPAGVLLYRLVPNAKARLALAAGGTALLVVGIVLLRTSDPVRVFLLENFGLGRLLGTNYNFADQASANAQLLLEGLGPLHLALAAVGLGLLWLRARRAQAAGLRAGALTASLLVAAAIYTQADARFKDMYYFVLDAALLWGAGLAGLAALFTAQAGTRRGAAGPGLALLAGAALLLPWARADVQALAELRRPDTRVASAEWLRRNVPQGARVACEYDCVGLTGGYGGFPGPQLFHTEVVGSLYERTPEEYRQNGIEYLFADNRADGYFSGEPDAAFTAEAGEVARFEGVGYKGPIRAILRVPSLQSEELYRWLGEAISFRGFDLPASTVTAGGELHLTLYWMSARVTPANLIVFTHLAVDEASQPVAGFDSPPLNGAQPTWAWEGDMQFWVDPRTVPVPADTPPGNYLLDIGMYDADTGERLPVLSPHGEALGTAVQLGVVTVIAADGP